MRTFVRHTLPIVRARGLIVELGIKVPSDIDIALIAAFKDAPVQELELTGCDGRMVRAGRLATITVRESIRFPGQKRFVIGHELGHVLLHPHVRQIDEVRLSQIANWSVRQSSEEIEANLFAAEILLPEILFTPRIRNIEPSFALIRALAEEFTTTLTATAIQFIRYTKEQCALVYCAGGRRKWVTISENFDFSIIDDTVVHPYSCAGDLSKTGEREMRASNVPAGCWLQEFSPDDPECLTEDAIASAGLGGVLSLLWVHDDI